MSITKCMHCMEDFDNAFDVCPHCGYPKQLMKKELHHLDIGYVLANRYILGYTIGSGGFGITYMAWDNVLNKRVAIKEYYPSNLVTRVQYSCQVRPVDNDSITVYEYGLRRFIDEASRLAKLNRLPHVVHVQDCVVENCTAYIIMDYVDGEDLMDVLSSRGPLPYGDVVNYGVQVLSALERVHQENLIHRDIAPDNIKINSRGEVVLIDFGATRVASDYSDKSLSVIYKPGYSPEEQYRENGVQGPWTDIYALAAVMYHMITGKRPISSTERCINDDLKTPRELGFIDVPEGVENAIMNALNIKAEFRFQSASEFASALEGYVPRIEPVKPEIEEEKKKTKLKALVIALCSVAIIVIAVGVGLFIGHNTSIDSNSNHSDEVLPQLINMELSEAEDTLNDLGIQFEIVGTEELNGVEQDKDIIAWQSISPKTPIEDIDMLQLKVAVAPIKKGIMPKLKYMTKAQAINALKKSNFDNYTFKTKIDNDVEENRVCDQSVVAEKSIASNAKIIVYIAKHTTTTKAQTYITTTHHYTQTTKKHTVVKPTKKQKTTKKQPQTTTKNTTTQPQTQPHTQPQTKPQTQPQTKPQTHPQTYTQLDVDW